MIKGLKVIHRQFIMHRDLKPENIMLLGSLENPIVKIADLELSKQITELTTGKFIVGKRDYLAHETLRGKK